MVQVGRGSADGEANPCARLGDRSEGNCEAAIVRQHVVFCARCNCAAKHLAVFDMAHQFLDSKLDTIIAGHSGGKVGGCWPQSAFAGHCNDGQQRHPRSACGKRRLSSAGDECAVERLRQDYSFLQAPPDETLTAGAGQMLSSPGNTQPSSGMSGHARKHFFFYPVADFEKAQRFALYCGPQCVLPKKRRIGWVFLQVP